MKEASTQDGAFAWLLCTMSFLNYVIIGGFIYATGMFYLMFKDSLNATNSEVALITSINTGVMHTIGPFAGILSERFGSRCVTVAGAVISTAGLACSAFSTKIFHLYISYGIIAGAGQGVISILSLTNLDPYFHKYKRIACGVSLAGMGAGSFILPPVLTYFEDMYGWRGAILLLAGINAHMMVTCSLFRPFETTSYLEGDSTIQNITLFKDEESSLDNGIMLPLKAVPDPEGNLGLVVESITGSSYGNKLHLNQTTSKSKGFIEVLSLFKIIPFVCVSACNLIIIFSVSIILTHFGSYLLTLNFTGEDVVNVYMTLGVGSTVARPLVGVVAEVTHANSPMWIMLSTLLIGMLTMCLPFMKQLWMMFVYAVMYQLLTGPYNTLGGSTIMEHVPKAQVATAYGIYLFLCVPGYALGAPMAAWLCGYTHVYAHTFYLAGGLMMLSGLTMAPAAYYIHKKAR